MYIKHKTDIHMTTPPRWTDNCNLPTQHQSEIILCNTDIKHRSQPEARPLLPLIREMAFGPLMDEVRVRGLQDISNYDPW